MALCVFVSVLLFVAQPAVAINTARTVQSPVLHAGPSHGANLVWIPSWPRSGSTTIFHMVLAAASETEDTHDGVARALEDRGRGESLYVPEMLPMEPGCWVLHPSGCHQPQNLHIDKKWARDGSEASHKSWAACEARRKVHNLWCKKKDTAMTFIPSVDYAASPFRRHFGLFEPCHKRYSSSSKPDKVVPELRGNCKLTMERLFNCDFRGIDFLWGWTRPHTDITGVTVLGANAPTFSPDLARRTCSLSDLIVYKTVDDYGRDPEDVIRMLGKFPHLKAVVPIRDPRAIYASWKDLPWNFPGVSLLKQICDHMSRVVHVKHDRLFRVVFEKLLADPELVMREAYGFLGFEFGKAQRRWISRTFNATCSRTAEQGNRFYSCHEDSEEPLNRWKEVLDNSEKWTFLTHPSCRQVAELYGYS